MGWFSRDAAGRGSSGITRADLDRLRSWIGDRAGVELYVEPATTTSGTTVLLIAHDGESTRQRVSSAREAADFARKVRLPIYDTNRVGIPARKREYDVRMARGGSAPSRPGPSVPPSGARTTGNDHAGPQTAGMQVTPAQRRAVATLAQMTGVELDDHPVGEDLQRLVRSARAHAHPDRNGGRREEWDRVEDAVRTLGLR